MKSVNIGRGRTVISRRKRRTITPQMSSDDIPSSSNDDDDDDDDDREKMKLDHSTRRFCKDEFRLYCYTLLSYIC